ncbi:hypothetical protein BYT27DRAFT_7210948 [Phlegmacium glaucopus]|nr:hypothetical protein BYT27DRAFT_7210948 [Phlegmacium glaucopus]
MSQVEHLGPWILPLLKKVKRNPIAELGHSDFYLCIVHLEVDLEAGNYIVYNNTTVNGWQLRTPSQILSEPRASDSIHDKNQFLLASLETLIQCDFKEYKKKTKASKETATTKTEEKMKDGTVTATTTTTTTTMTKVETVMVNNTAANMAKATTTATKSHQPHQMQTLIPLLIALVSVKETYVRVCNNITMPTTTMEIPPETGKEEEKGKVTMPHDDSNSVYVGLRVYTHKDVPAVVVGWWKAVIEVRASTDEIEG